MKNTIVFIGIWLCMPSLALAQAAKRPYQVQGYGFIGNDGYGIAGGGGGEFIDNGFGAGGEFAKSRNPFGETMLSINASYHILHFQKQHVVEPFVTGGFTRFSIGSLLPPTNGGNFGAGANLWLTKHTALRLEVRDAIGARGLSIDFEPEGNNHYGPKHLVTYRIGVTFR